MTSRARLLAPVLLLALGFACGQKEEEAPVAIRPASGKPGAAATEAPAGASSPSAVQAATPLPSARTAASAASAPALPAPVSTLQARRPQAPPAPPAATAAPPPPAQADKPPVTLPAATAAPPPPAQADKSPVTLPAAQQPKGKITLPAKLGAVTFDHESHVGERGVACTTCHHPSRPQKPLVSERQACRDCHAMPAAPPMQTSLRAAFHDPKGATGTCIDCHRQKGGSAPVKCLECHKKS